MAAQAERELDEDEGGHGWFECLILMEVMAMRLASTATSTRQDKSMKLVAMTTTGHLDTWQCSPTRLRQ